MPIIQRLTDKLFKTEFYRNILRLFAGLFTARIFPSLFALVIVRIYSPENFGLFVLYLTIASALSIISTGKYENAIILADHAEQQKLAFSLARKINIGVNTLAAILIAGYLLIARINDTSKITLLLLIPVFAYFFAGIQLIRHRLISQKEFRILSYLEIGRALATGILQCLLFIWPQTGLFIGAVLAQAGVYMFYLFRLREKPSLNLELSTSEKQLGLRYLNFPKYSIGSEILNFLSSQLPIFLIKPFFGASSLGLYSFPHRYINSPVQILSNSVSRVYIQEAQLLKQDDQRLAALSFDLFKKQVLLAILPFTVLALWGEGLFSFLFGTEWAYAGKLAQLISPWLFAVSISSPLSAILIIREKQRFSLVFNLLLIGFRVASLLVGFLLFNNLNWTIGLYSLTGFLFFVFLGYYSLHLARVKTVKAAFFSLKILALVFLPLFLLKLWI